MKKKKCEKTDEATASRWLRACQWYLRVIPKTADMYIELRRRRVITPDTQSLSFSMILVIAKNAYCKTI